VTTADVNVAALAIDSAGRIVAAGYAGVSPNVDFAAARYNGDGSPDATFGVNGSVITSFAITQTHSMGSALALDTMGRIVVAGTAGPLCGPWCGDNNFAVVRYLGGPLPPVVNTYLPLILR